MLRFLKALVPGQKNFVRVLLYHNIHDMAKFKQHIAFLYGHYKFIDADSFEKMIKGEIPIKGGNLFLTFDDGFMTNYEAAFTVLDPLNIKACFFVVSDFIDCPIEHCQDFVEKNILQSNLPQGCDPSEYAPMRWPDLQALQDIGHTIGFHTKTHRRLSLIRDEAALEEELLLSTQSFSDKLNKPVAHFAYTFGDINSINAWVLRKAAEKYYYIYSGVRGKNKVCQHRASVRRESISLDCNLRYLRFIIEGGLSIFYVRARKSLDKMVAAL